MTGRGRVIRIMSGGVVDAGLASMATFAVGIAATRLLTPADLGVYAIYFTAFLTGTEIPARLIFTPAEVVGVSYRRGQRSRVLRRSLVVGQGAAAASALVMLAAAAASWQITSGGTIAALTITSMIAAFLSPVQDHVRRVLIKDDLSWRAAATSGVQVVAVAGALVALWLVGVDPAWLPFGALAAANVVSLLVGLELAGFRGARPLPEEMTMRSLSSSGRFLVISQLVPTAAAFVAATAISRLAGAAELGYAEAARLAAQPLLVVALGLAAAFEPRFMEAAGRRDSRRARRGRLAFYGVLAGAGAGYLLVGGWVWPGNPMAYLMPDAYVIRGLVAVYIVANLANGATYGGWGELVGGGRSETLAKINPIASVSWLLAAGTAGVTGAFARPLGLLLQSIVRQVLYWPAKRQMYLTPPTMAGDPSPEGAVEAEATPS